MKTRVQFPITSLRKLKRIAKQVKKIDGHSSLSKAQRALAKHLKFDDWHHAAETLRRGSIIEGPGQVKAASRMTVIIDEAWDLLSNPRYKDPVYSFIHNIEAVPKHEYEMDGKSVFVFEKLASLVKSAKGINTSIEEVVAMIPSAKISIQEAVRLWKIVPSPYKVTELPDGSFNIQNEPLNSVVAASPKNRSELFELLESLFLGEQVAGTGDFYVNGVPFVSTAPMQLSSLPDRPVFFHNIESDQKFRNGLHKFPSIENDLPFMSKEDYYSLRTITEDFENDEQLARRIAASNERRFRRFAEVFPWQDLNPRSSQPWEIVPNTLKELREYYPELSDLTDVALYDFFDNYQSDYCYLSSWEASREFQFFMYLIGELSGLGSGRDSVHIGEMVFFKITQGLDLSAGFEFARSWIAYSRALWKLSFTVREATKYVLNQSGNNMKFGPAISIWPLSDAYRILRKHDPLTVTVTQSFENLPEFSQQPLFLKKGDD